VHSTSLSYCATYPRERVLISLFCSMGFVVWVVTYLWLAQLGGDRKGVEKEQN